MSQAGVASRFGSARWKAGAACLASALPLAAALRGFTVDDAFVTARVASRLSLGEGYRFNAAGPEVDAVTPLGFAHLLAVAGPGSPLVMLERARWVGLLAWLAAALVLGLLLPPKQRALATALPLVAVSAPLAAWASSGMETGLVTLATTFALFGGPAGALAAGLAAAWRPELLVFAVVLAGGGALLGAPSLAGRARRLAIELGLAAGPALAVALVRQGWFGTAAPLAVLAKPSDLTHGAAYALSGFVLAGAPLLLLAPRGLRAADLRTRLLAVAVIAHFAAIAAAGGDWMALFRLVVPVLPACILAGARLADDSTSGWRWVRLGAALIASLGLLGWRGLPARSVLPHRLELIRRAEPVLRDARSIAALDIGWVGAATNARILDLAGITDPMVARLPGGHTSKRVSAGLIENRDVDTFVLLLAPRAAAATPWNASIFTRVVENRLAELPLLEDLHPRATLPLGGTEQLYLVLERPAGRRGSGAFP
jgi:hypothetical protein